MATRELSVGDLLDHTQATHPKPMKRTRVEPGIYRQVNGTYAVYYLLNGKPRFKTIGPKLAEARRARTQLLAKAERGELATPTRPTFAGLAASWLEGYAAL